MAKKWTRLIALRKERNLSQLEAAKVLGLTRSAFAMYELRQREPDMETIRNMATYFNVTTDYLLGRSDSRGGVADETISEEWRRVINQCKAMGLEPEQVLRALAGLSIISEAMESKPNKKDREP
ncbi:MAG: helix-turn-helix domain-containing protein [Bacillota bacterium]